MKAVLDPQQAGPIPGDCDAVQVVVRPPADQQPGDGGVSGIAQPERLAAADEDARTEHDEGDSETEEERLGQAEHDEEGEEASGRLPSTGGLGPDRSAQPQRHGTHDQRDAYPHQGSLHSTPPELGSNNQNIVPVLLAVFYESHAA